MSRDQSRRRIDMSRTVFFCWSTCQTDRHSVGFQQRISIDRLQCGRMLVDIDSVQLDKHWKNFVAFYFDNNKFSMYSGFVEWYVDLNVDAVWRSTFVERQCRLTCCEQCGRTLMSLDFNKIKKSGCGTVSKQKRIFAKNFRKIVGDLKKIWKWRRKFCWSCENNL